MKPPGRRSGDVSMGVLLQMVQQNDDKQEDAHKRLRRDYRVLQDEFDRVQTEVTTLKTNVEGLKVQLHEARTANVDIGQVVFNPKMVAAIVGLAISIVGANWLSNQPIRDGLTVLREQVTGNTKIEDERAKVFKDAIDGLTKAMEMRRLEIQQVGNSVQQIQRGQH